MSNSAPRFPDDWTSCPLTLGEIATTTAVGPSEAAGQWVRAQLPRQFPQCGAVMAWAAQMTGRLIQHLSDPPLGRNVSAVMMGLLETGAVMCAICDGGESYVVLLAASDVPGICESCVKAARTRAMGLN